MGAFIRYRLAAEMGYRTALANIGYIYEHGIEDEKMQVPVDLSRAMHFYELCAQQNDAVCRRRLGDMYYYGHGVLINYTAAAQQYRLNLNDPQSCFNLAWLTERGLGVTQDREEARHRARPCAGAAHMRGAKFAVVRMCECCVDIRWRQKPRVCGPRQ